MKVTDNKIEVEKIAIFDFDGTITTKDSLKDFIIYIFGFTKFVNTLIILSPMLFLYLFKIIPNHRAKEILFKHLFKDMSFKVFSMKTTRYSLSNIKFYLRKIAIEKIKWHKAQGHRVIIVSASIVNWIEPWATREGIETVLATELEVNNGKLTGNFSNKNCYGIEKVNRVKKYLDKNSNYYIYAYGDSRGDKELLEFANEGYYNFKKVIK